MEPGSLIAETLRGAWRIRPPALKVTADQLALVAPLLVERGEAALGWWKVRHSALRTSSAALKFRQAYLLQTVQVEIYQAAIGKLTHILRAEPLEVMLGKGLAASHLYPELGMRPAGDIDLYVRPDQYPAALAILDKLNQLVSANGLFSVDLHCGTAELDDRSFKSLYQRSQMLGAVRVFSAEDHLRLLCIHALRHGMCRPLWLCDIAAAVESRAADFDWEYLFSGDARRAGWVRCALQLAHRLIGARLPDMALAPLPEWLPQAVIKQWQTPNPIHGRRAPMILHLRRRTALVQALRQRWPNPIEATVTLRRPFDTRLQLPLQLGSSLVRLARLTGQLLTEARSGHR
ncbi:MAG TPA: nucleotidyltransferase family protein [Pyrinomonadaceae bacterium]|jgi:hypothetical protein|nr:nucleotidyltransferase family protein [Pyrinomonadaceae bacterium]